MKSSNLGEPYTIPLYDNWTPQVGDVIYDGKGGYVKVLSVHKTPFLKKLMSTNRNASLRGTIKVQPVQHP